MSTRPKGIERAQERALVRQAVRLRRAFWWCRLRVRKRIKAAIGKVAPRVPKRRRVSQAAQKSSHVSLRRTVTQFSGDKPLKPRQERVALVLAQGILPETHLAVVNEVSRRTLYRWRQNPAFRARIEYFQAQIAAAELQRAIEESRSRAEQQDPDVRDFYARATARKAGIDEAERQPVHTPVLSAPRLEFEEQMRQLEARQAAARPVPIASVVFESPEQRQRKAFERYCYGPAREPQCLSFDIMHSHTTR